MGKVLGLSVMKLVHILYFITSLDPDIIIMKSKTNVKFFAG